MQSVFLPLTAVLLVVSTPVMAETTDTEPVNILVADFSRAEDDVCQPGVIAGWIEQSLEEFDSIKVVLLNETVSAEENTEFYMELMRSAECDLIVFGSAENAGDAVSINFYYIPAENSIENNPLTEPVLKEFSFDLTGQPQSEIPQAVQFNSSALATITLLNAQQFHQALEASEETLSLAETIGSSEDQSSAFSIRGMVLLVGFSDSEQALSDFDTALSLNPENTGALQNRASLFSSNGHYAQAVSDITTLLELEPEGISMLLSRGYTYYLAGLYTEAAIDYDTYIGIDPYSADAYYGRSLALFRRNNTSGALDDLRMTMDLDPAFIDAYLDAAVILINNGEFEEADSLLTEARGIDEENLRIYVCSVILFISIEDWDSALVSANAGLSMAPNDPFFYKSRAVINIERGQFQEAWNDLDTVIGFFREGNYGSCTDRDLGRLEGNTEKLARFVHLPHDTSEYFLQRGIYLSDQSRFEEAIQDFTHALSLDSNNVYALYHRGIAHARTGSREGAVRDLEAFLLVCPEGTSDAKLARSQLNYIMQQ